MHNLMQQLFQTRVQLSNTQNDCCSLAFFRKSDNNVSDCFVDVGNLFLPLFFRNPALAHL